MTRAAKGAANQQEDNMAKGKETGLITVRSFASRRDVMKTMALGTAGLALSGTFARRSLRPA